MAEPPETPLPDGAGPEQSMDLEGAIAALPEGCRTVFVLHDVEGLRHEEIASLTGTAVGTSKAHLFRARRLLRQALDR
jgi:RNA polymerase sigma-70 factor (ECF subfamily)